MSFWIHSRKKTSKPDDEEVHLVPSQISGNGAPNATSSERENAPNDSILKFLFCSGGIYAAYLVYGTLQEDVFTYRSKAAALSDSPKFIFVWLVQVLEAFVNTLFAAVGYAIQIQSSGQSYRKRKHLPIRQSTFFFSGISQVMSKACTSLSLANGLSFPVATMAKSAKMAPVMLGQLVLGGSRYHPRDYLQVLAIIIGTAVLGLSKGNHGTESSHSSFLGTMFILLSLVLDGVTGGLQKSIKRDAQNANQPVNGFQFMALTNLHMTFVALFVSIFNGDLVNGFKYIKLDPDLMILLCKFCFCSAVGQAFIFFTIAIFDPLVVSTITTTRKIISVLLSVFCKGHHLNHQGWCGILLAFGGIASELKDKFTRNFKKDSKKEDIESQ
jgi:UDP-galactose transporter B1